MLLHAHCEGMLDLGGDVLDARWWLRAGLVADYVFRQLRLRAYEQRFQFNLALLNYTTTEQTFNLHHTQAELARCNAIQQMMPWLDAGPKTSEDVVTAMRTQYLRHFADPQSEKGKEAIRKQLMKWGSSYARRFLAKR